MSPSSFAAAGVADLSGRTKLRLTGADRVRFLNGQVSNDVRLASETASIYTCVMTIKGKMCADAFIHSTGDALVLDAEPAVRESLAARLEKYIIADDVTLEDVSDEVGLLHFLPGMDDAEPASVELAAALAAPGTGWRCVYSQRYGGPGLDIFGSPAALEEARGSLAARVPLLNAASLETRRILAGVPQWGAELDENIMPAEAGLEDRAVSYTKGCYIGQEVVSRVKSVGHVNRQLRGLRVSQTGFPAAGWSLFPAGSDAGGREVGRITSVTPASAEGPASIALAFVRRGWETAGTVLAARPAPPKEPSTDAQYPLNPDVSRGECEVVVCALPFA